MNHGADRRCGSDALTTAAGSRGQAGSLSRCMERSWRQIAAVSLAALVFAVRVEAQDANAAEEPVLDNAAIAAGQEELISEMLGGGTTLGGGCVLSEAGIQYTVITASYACPDGQVVLELGHPSEAGRDAVPTARFAITVRSGRPPGNLLDSVVSKVRAHEDGFQWTWTESGARRVAPQ